jgi:hypothetical protein
MGPVIEVMSENRRAEFNEEVFSTGDTNTKGVLGPAEALPPPSTLAMRMNGEEGRDDARRRGSGSS